MKTEIKACSNAGNFNNKNYSNAIVKSFFNKTSSVYYRLSKV